MSTTAENPLKCTILTIDQVAAYLSIPKATLYTWRTRRAGFGKRGILSLDCSLTYSTQLEDVNDSAYEFVAVDQSDPEESLNTALVSGASLRDGHGPELFESFCPSCPPEL